VRGLLVLVLIIGVCLGWIVYVVRRAQRQRDAVAAVRKVGGSVLYDWQFEGSHVRVKPGTNTISNEVPVWPTWLVDRLDPDFFGHVTQVSFGRNRLDGASGPIDDALSSVGQLGRLTDLTLIGSPVTDTGLAHLRGLSDLESLMLRGCTGFSDAGLVHLERMVSLKGLYLDDAKVTDTGLAHLRGMARLEVLGLDRAGVTDAGLVHLEGMSRLRFLNPRRTRVTDAGLTRLKALKGLRSLNLEGSEVSDVGLVHLKDLRLKELWLGGPKITDAGLAQLGEMSGLTTLGLDHARITDAGLVHVERLTGLEKLSLSGTQVTDNGLVCLKKLSGLRRLFLLDATPVTREGVQQLQKALPSLKIDY
jgi:Leucine-rich repeat (LRR) protein